MSTKKRKKQAVLSNAQIRILRGLGHHLNPLAMVGKEGISDTLVQSVNDNLDAHELVKIRVQDTSPLDRKEAATALADATGSALVQVIGKTFLLYHENKDRKDEGKIFLPKNKKNTIDFFIILNF